MANKRSWGWSMDTKWYHAVLEEEQKHKYPCPKCGRKMIIAYKKDKTICDYCGTLIYKDEKAKFKDKMKKMMRKRKEENENGRGNEENK